MYEKIIVNQEVANDPDYQERLTFKEAAVLLYVGSVGDIGTDDLSKIAEEADTSVGDIEKIINELIRKGYMQELD